MQQNSNNEYVPQGRYLIADSHHQPEQAKSTKRAGARQADQANQGGRQQGGDQGGYNLPGSKRAKQL